MARHAAESQRVSAANVARANEPGYRAQELESFQEFLARAVDGHVPGDLEGAFKTRQSNTPVAPNGNSVSLEMEAFKSAEAMGEHTLAMTVYGKSLDLLRTALGKAR
ncbi:MAG: flagellar biosynthesis protein FlgB [Hyphomonadaceae bacterium]|nr:flagellar biosynthesis protein FlgB [Hyphomonadaceae bacterium]